MTRNISSGMKSIITLGSLAILTLPLGADVERGKQLYAQVCFLCHGSELEGGKGPALTDAYWRHGSSEQEILKILNEGVKGTEMVGYGAYISGKRYPITALLPALEAKRSAGIKARGVCKGAF